ncbi:MAG: T9SS type A sorting domain-containing protein [Bacteroidota bacterium]
MIQVRLYSTLLLLCSIIISVPAQERLQFDWILTQNEGQGSDLKAHPEFGLIWGFNSDISAPFDHAKILSLDEEGNQSWTDTSSTEGFINASYGIAIRDSIVLSAGASCDSADFNDCTALMFATNLSDGEPLWSREWRYDTTKANYLFSVTADETHAYWLGVSRNSAEENLQMVLLKTLLTGEIVEEFLLDIFGEGDYISYENIFVDSTTIYIPGAYRPNSPSNSTDSPFIAAIDKVSGTLTKSLMLNTVNNNPVKERRFDMSVREDYIYTSSHTMDAKLIIINKFDKDFNLLWQTTTAIDSSYGVSIKEMAIGDDESIYLGSDLVNVDGSGDRAIGLLKFSPEGNLEGYKTWGDTWPDWISDILFYNNNIYISGVKDSSNGLLMKVNADNLTSTQSIAPSQLSHLKVFPNPTQEFSTLSFFNPEHKAHQVIVYDIWGRIVFSQSDIYSNNLELAVMSWSAGLYFVELWKDTEQVGREKLVVSF